MVTSVKVHQLEAHYFLKTVRSTRVISMLHN